MKKISLTTLIIALFAIASFSQQLTQTVRGSIVDADSKLPMVGVGVVIEGTNPIVGASTDVSGNFRIDNIEIGRITLQLSYMGYETKTIPSIEVRSGKEVVLDLNMQESVIKVNEVVVKASKNKGEALNDMSIISSRSISIEETKRYAGGFDDPARILSNFAGVTNTQDGSADIIVRGNSPKYIQWRLEGIEITNPSHFEDQNSSSGANSALNNNLLAASDFYTGAFSPEFGDVLSGVYDVKLRQGNNEKFESTLGIGLIGTDFTFEGPFKKGYTGSFLVNYRYSTISLIKDLGLVNLDGTMNFQDGLIKVVLPTKKFGNFSIFGMAGLNGFLLDDIKASMWQTPGDRAMSAEIVEDYDKDNYLYNTGLNHTLTINKNSFFKTSLSYSGTGLRDDIFESRIIKTDAGQGAITTDTVGRTLNYTSRINNSALRFSATYSNKIDAKNKIQIGTKYTLFVGENHQSMLDEDLVNRQALVDFDGNLGALRNFISWKHNVSKDFTIVAGVHNMNILQNNESTIEPRVAVNWQINNSNSVHAGYGNHSNMERIHNYFTKVEIEDGTVTEPNKDLRLLKANHFVLGYEKSFTENLKAKVEIYYQHLYDLPVENNDTSYYSTINEGQEYRYVDLVNKGKGRNYGLEFTLERFFNNNYYFLINTSIYDSKYTALDGVERNTRYNGNYLFNVLAGKEFNNLGSKNNQTLSLNAKLFYGGGAKIIQLLRDGQGNLAVDPENNKYWDYKNAYKNKLEDTYQIVLTASYKFNRPRATHEIFLDLQNVTNNKGKVTEFYDESKPNSIGYLTQFGFFPNLMYRVYF